MSVLSFAAPSDLALNTESTATTQTPLAPARSSFLETAAATTALRGGFAMPRSSALSHLHVPVESLPAEAGSMSRSPWQARMAGPRAFPQTQQWTARMPVTLARGMRDDYSGAQPSQGYNIAQDAAGASESAYGLGS